MIKNTLRSAAISFLYNYYFLTGRLRASLRRNRVQFLYLHHVFKDEESRFRDILKELGKDHVFIGYSEAVKRIRSGTIDKPYISISFDDGLKNCMAAADIMKEFSVKACFFVCPSIVGERDHAKIKKFCAERMHRPPVEFLDWSDIENLLISGHEIGSHTNGHVNLSLLPDSELQDEIGGSYSVLKQKTGEVKHFSWPFGRFRHFGPAAAKMVFDSGFISCASAERGCHISKADKKEDLCIRRDHIAAGWPLSHIKYFLAKSSFSAKPRNNEWPENRQK